MVETLISSKTRIKLLVKFFLNSKTTGYLRNLETEFGESTNAIRVELNKFEKAGMLESFSEGNKKIFKANTLHPFFDDIHSIVMKYVGIDKIVENIAKRLGDVVRVYLTGEFSKGLDAPVIDLLIIGQIDRAYLSELVAKAEPMVKRKIRYVIYTEKEFTDEDFAAYSPEPLLLWRQ
ncbi:MAG: ArsR family transcriptional regulator [Bacteroidota bacterium]